MYFLYLPLWKWVLTRNVNKKSQKCFTIQKNVSKTRRTSVFRTIKSMKLQGDHFYIMDFNLCGNQAVKEFLQFWGLHYYFAQVVVSVDIFVKKVELYTVVVSVNAEVIHMIPLWTQIILHRFRPELVFGVHVSLHIRVRFPLDESQISLKQIFIFCKI